MFEISEPNFLFIGPDKAGSSWMFDILRQHPDCYVPPAKDIYFFDRYYEKGFDWYLGHFRDASDTALAVGELSHDYLFSAVAAERILDFNPKMKLLVSLRNPIERTFSQYLYMLRSGYTSLNFSGALMEYPFLIDNSLYGKHLETYLNIFPAENIKILWFEDLQKDPRIFASTLFGHLGVPFDNSLEYDTVVRGASQARSVVLSRIIRGAANAARNLGAPNLVGHIKNSHWINIFYKEYAEDKPVMDKDSISKMLGFFEEDVRVLEKIANRDLSVWTSKYQLGEL